MPLKNQVKKTHVEMTIFQGWLENMTFWVGNFYFPNSLGI